MTKPHMTLPNGDVLYEGDYAVTRDGQRVGPIMKHHVGGDEVAFIQKEGDGLVWRSDGTGRSEKAQGMDLVAKWTDQDDTPVMWRDMTPEQKGALLLAHHEGKFIQYIDPNDPDDSWSDVVDPGFDSSVLSYRIKPSKPEPKVETVTLLWSKAHSITFNLIDGKPDCDSVRMEEL